MEIAQAHGAIHGPRQRQHDPEILGVARELETAFLSEMLGSAGLMQATQGPGGGPGEAQFASFMTDAHARALVAAGGLGLAELLADALAAQRDRNPG